MNKREWGHILGSLSTRSSSLDEEMLTWQNRHRNFTAYESDTGETRWYS